MAKKFVTGTQNKYDSLSNKDQYNESIVFLSDSKKIIAHGEEYQCLPTDRIRLKQDYSNTDLEPGYICVEETDTSGNSTDFRIDINPLEVVCNALPDDEDRWRYSSITSDTICFENNNGSMNFTMRPNGKAYINLPDGLGSPGQVLTSGGEDGSVYWSDVQSNNQNIFETELLYSNKNLNLNGSSLSQGSTTIIDSNGNIIKATDSVVGGIKTGYTTNNKNYKVQTDNNGNAYVNVPWSDSDTKNTTGATEYNVNGALYLIGASSRGNNPQTYTHDFYVRREGDDAQFRCDTGLSIISDTDIIYLGSNPGYGVIIDTDTLYAPALNGSGSYQVATKADMEGTRLIKSTHSSATFNTTLNPFTYYVCSTALSSLVISGLNAPKDTNLIGSYIIEFKPSTSSMTLTLPTSVKWMNGSKPSSFDTSATYQISIVNNLATYQKFK